MLVARCATVALFLVRQCDNQNWNLCKLKVSASFMQIGRDSREPSLAQSLVLSARGERIPFLAFQRMHGVHGCCVVPLSRRFVARCSHTVRAHIAHFEIDKCIAARPAFAVRGTRRCCEMSRLLEMIRTRPGTHTPDTVFVAIERAPFLLGPLQLNEM